MNASRFLAHAVHHTLEVAPEARAPASHSLVLGCETHLGADMDMVDRPMSLMLCTTEATPNSSSLLTRAMTSSCGLQQPQRNLRRNW